MSCPKGNKEEPKVVTNTETVRSPPDGGWGWVVCFASFMINFISQGMTASNGIILLGIKDLFDESISKATPVCSVNSALAMCGGPLVLILLHCKVSHRQIMMIGGVIAAASTIFSVFSPRIEILILTYGVIGGLSMAVVFFASNVILGSYFDKKLAIAAGIANSGSGVGCVALNHLIERSISFYGMRGTFSLIGGILLNMTVFGSLCRPLKSSIISSPVSETERNSKDKKQAFTNQLFVLDEGNAGKQVEEKESTHRKGTDLTESEPEMRKFSAYSMQSSSDAANDAESPKSRCCDIRIFKNKIFCLLLAIYMLWAVGEPLLIYLPAYAESVGLNRRESSSIMSFFGIVSTLSQFLFGFLANIIHIPISYILLSSLFGMSLSILIISFCHIFETLAMGVIMFAIFYGFGLALRLVLVAEVLGAERISTAYSVMTILVGIGYSIYPQINAIVYDATHSFTMIFYMDSTLTFLGGVLSCGVIYAQKKGKFYSGEFPSRIPNNMTS